MAIKLNSKLYDIMGGETLPVGSEIDYDGSTVPTGWEETTPIIESGTDYIKYKDGTMICYGRATIRTSINIQYGSAYRTDVLSITLSQTFVDTNYRVFLQPVAPMHVCYKIDDDKTTNLFKFYGVAFVNQAASADRQIDYVAIGKWK